MENREEAGTDRQAVEYGDQRIERGHGGETHQVASGDSMLGIYLNDHLAGATAGTELAHRMARSHGDGEDSGTFRRLASEIAQDRAALLDIMTALGIKVRHYKVGAAWIGEKACG